MNNIVKKIAYLVLLSISLKSGMVVASEQEAAPVPVPVFRNALTGVEIDFSFGKKGEDTEATKHFMITGENIYNQDEDVIRVGADLYMAACSGCHGHYVEGKIGPALGDSYWTYPQGKKDKGLFEIVYDGARAMMGPQRNQLTIDEMLQVMSYIRSVYWDKPEDALWLSEEQRATLVPAEMPADFREALEIAARDKAVREALDKAESDKAALENATQ